MGVRGLTTFIAANAEVYLKPHELHDTKLVIDGDNLCVQLFKKSQLTSSPLGGNYDLYHRLVVDFFKMLTMCNVIPYVLLDGGYEARKMATVKGRMLQNICCIKNLNLAATGNARPLMVREVFVDALRSAGVNVMRCAFEADDEAAILARKLNCPVMSYDSDFYIHNVQYIPYVTVTHKVYRKVTDKEGENFEIGVVEWNRSKAGASQRVKFVAQYGDERVVKGDAVETYCYLDCCMYTIDSLIGPDARLQKDMIPLFAVLLGNDYIERKVLAPFYRTIKSGRVNRKISGQQRRIKVILKWLQNHTIQSATRTIVNHVREGNKKRIYRQILTAMRGYNCEDCISFRYFGFSDTTDDHLGELEDDEVEKHIQDGLGTEDECDPDADAALEEGNLLDDEEETEQSEEAEEEDNDTERDASSDEEEGAGTDNARNVEDLSSSQDSTDTEDMEYADLTNLEPFRNKYTDYRWPEWFRELYRSAKVPRFLADLLHSNIYLNYPQIEDINKPDSNTISYPILRMIFAILKSASHRPADQFKYITRKVKVTGLSYVTFEDAKLPEGVQFDPAKPGNIGIMQALFKECSLARWKDLFKSIRNLPAKLQLYFLAIIYWAKNCNEVSKVHVQALVVCILQLQIVDPSLKSKNRDAKLFHKQHKLYLEEQRKALKTVAPPKGKDDDQSEGELTRAFYNQLSSATSRPELMLVYDTLVGHFSPNEKLNRKHTSIDRAVVHTLAAFQSVCYNLFALVPLLGYPFENVRMHELFNSMLVYNVYETMKSRANPDEYALTVFYRHSPMLQAAFLRMVKFVETFVPELQDRRRTVRGQAKAAARKGKAADDGKHGNKKNAPSVAPRPRDGRVAEQQEQSSSESDNEGFVDMNNKFSQLLLAT
uniref:XPG_I_2 domain-containing protein n=1 Tax=Anopheles atroparvus TaxID=41427 RepID=A0A182JAW0_ANOAO